MNCSKLWRLCKQDVVKDFIVAVLVAALSVIYESWTKGIMKIDWSNVEMIVGIAAIGYILKQLGTGQNGKFLSNK